METLKLEFRRAEALSEGLVADWAHPLIQALPQFLSHKPFAKPQSDTEETKETTALLKDPFLLR